MTYIAFICYLCQPQTDLYHIVTNRFCMISGHRPGWSGGHRSRTSLARRIHTAAIDVCLVEPNKRDLAAKANSKRCSQTAVSGARTAVAMAMAPQIAWHRIPQPARMKRRAIAGRMTDNEPDAAISGHSPSAGQLVEQHKKRTRQHRHRLRRHPASPKESSEVFELIQRRR